MTDSISETDETKDNEVHRNVVDVYCKRSSQKERIQNV